MLPGSGRGRGQTPGPEVSGVQDLRQKGESPMQRAQGSLCPAGVGGRPRTPLVSTSGSTHPPPKNKTQIINNSIFYSVQNFSTYENKVYKWQITLEPQRPGDLQDLSGRESGAGAAPLPARKAIGPPAKGHAPSALHGVTHRPAPAIPRAATRGQHHPGLGASGWGVGRGCRVPRDSQVKRQKPPKVSPSPPSPADAVRPWGLWAALGRRGSSRDTAREQRGP